MRKNDVGKRIDNLCFRCLLRLKRNSLGVTQKQLADKLGISYTVISQYERGVRKPKIETIIKIVEALESIEQSQKVSSNKGKEVCFCNECGNNTKLYKFEGEQLCIDCIAERLPVVEGSE